MSLHKRVDVQVSKGEAKNYNLGDTLIITFRGEVKSLEDYFFDDSEDITISLDVKSQRIEANPEHSMVEQIKELKS